MRFALNIKVEMRFQKQLYKYFSLVDYGRVILALQGHLFISDLKGE